MNTFFWICWTIDAVILAVLVLEALLTGSGFGLVLLLMALLGLTWYLRVSSPVWALLLACLPTAVLLVFVFGLAAMFITGRSNWN